MKLSFFFTNFQLCYLNKVPYYPCDYLFVSRQFSALDQLVPYHTSLEQ